MPKRPATDDAPAVELSPPHLEGVDELSAEVFRALHATLRLHKQLMTRTLAAHGTHPGQATCLRLLAVHDGITQRDLADALHLARPTVSKMLQAMEKAGVVERRPDETDQRLTCVKLTAAGRALERDLRAVAADYVNETIGTLPEGDRRELARLLDDLAASISRATDEL
jgi:DNA-binding MarR family transcriptional regulator